MSENRRRNANIVPVASLFTSFVIGGFILAAGMGYVSLKNQLHRGADEIKHIERELDLIALKITVVKSETQKLTSVDALKKRYDADKTRLGGLIDIAPDRIVWVDRPRNVATLDTPDVQQTSNPKR
ncbi:MAG: hypothetical protein ABMA13_05420 [Chthoniobacteraceae bacterium]